MTAPFSSGLKGEQGRVKVKWLKLVCPWNLLKRNLKHYLFIFFVIMTLKGMIAGDPLVGVTLLYSVVSGEL